MPRSKKSRESRRCSKIAIRLLPKQRRKLVRAARTSGLTLSAYLSTLIDAKPRRSRAIEPPPDLVPFPLLAQWQRAGNNINQIARAVHRGRTVEAEWLVMSMNELLALMIEDQITRRYAVRFGADGIARRAATLG